ncbi:ribokinase [Arthrobacter sp. MDT2-16]
MNSSSIVVVGSINADIVVDLDRHPQPGETVLGRSLKILPGGKGANQAVAAAKLGAPVSMIGAVGADHHAEVALAGLRAAGVNLSAVQQVSGSTGVAIVQVATSGENSIVVLAGVNADITVDTVTAAEDVLDAASIVIVQGEIPEASVAAAILAARGRVIVNLAPVITIDRSALLKANPLVVNEHEALLVLQQFAEATIPMDTQNHEAVLEELLHCGFLSVVLTLGAAGALLSENGSVVRIPAPRVSALDTTGAGDAFVGALAAQLLIDDNLVSAAEFAVRVGSFAVQRQGAQPSYPTTADTLPALL